MKNANKKVLIVEDDSSFLWLLKAGLKDKGFDIISAEDGEDGLKKVEEENPDLILLDIMLPKMDGLTMAKKLKEKNLNFDIIFLTQYSDVEHISQAVELSKETDYIVKSDMHIEQIAEKIKKRLRIND
jgi:DNA-binding response OmpR family regulator